jgi:hypothetical protein
MASTDPSKPEADEVLICLDGSGWKNVLDFYKDLFEALGSPFWHGHSPDALVDSIVWGGINEREPPYRVVVNAVLDPEIRDHVGLCGRCIAQSRQEYRQSNDQDARVSLELVD